jgi:hypothetical protein
MATVAATSASPVTIAGSASSPVKGIAHTTGLQQGRGQHQSSAGNAIMRTCTPEVLWHGGGNEHGKPDPVFSVDISANNVMATGGIDASVPPKGSVRVSEHAAVVMFICI